MTAVTKSVVFLQSSEDASGTVVFAGVYSVDELPAAATEANAKLVEYYAKQCGDAVAGRALPFVEQLRKLGSDPSADKPAMQERLLRCRAMSEAGVDNADRDGGLIRIQVAAPALARSWLDFRPRAPLRPAIPLRVCADFVIAPIAHAL